MISTSGARWTNQTRSSGQRICKVDLYYNKQPTPILTDLEVVSGSLTVDSTAANRRTGSIVLANTDLLTSNPNLSVEPYGLELGVRWGVVYPNGATEMVMQGIYQFSETTWEDDQGSIPALNLVDRSGWIVEQFSQSGFEDYGGQTHVAAIQDMLHKSVFVLISTSTTRVDPSTLSAAQIHLVVDPAVTAADFKVPGGAPVTGNFWDNITSYAADLNAQIYFAEDGVNVILRPIDVLDTSSSAFDCTFLTGNYGDILTASRTLSRSGVYNGVSATGALPANAASAQTPPWVFVYDNDPNSKTYYWGPFGRIVLPITSDTITGKDALTTWAKQQLAKGLGLARSVDLSVLANGAIEPGDVAQVTFLSGEQQVHLVQSIELDLVGATMSVTTESQNQV